MTSKGEILLGLPCHTANLFIHLSFHIIVCSSTHPENGVKVIYREASSLQLGGLGFFQGLVYDPDLPCISRVL